jgi:tight adherence protein B
MWPAFIAAGTSGAITSVLLWRVMTLPSRRFGNQSATQRLHQMSEAVREDVRHLLPPRETRYSNLPALRKALSYTSFAPKTHQFLEQAGVGLNVGSFFLLNVLSLTACGLAAYWLKFSPLYAISALVITAAGPTYVISSKRQARLRKLTEQLPEATRMIASAMRAGLSLETGVDIVAAEAPDPIRSEFQKLMNEWRLTSDLKASFRSFSTRIPLDDFRLFAASVSLHRDAGGNFSQILDQLGETIRGRFRLWRELKTLTAESRFSGWLLGGFPFIIGSIIYSVDPLYLVPLFETPEGKIALSIVVVLQILGFVTIRLMTSPNIE